MLRSVVGVMPPPAWFTLRAQAADQLRMSLHHVLAGSAWREPDEVLRDCAIAREGLHETAKLIAAALGKIDTHFRRTGLGGVDRSAAAAPMPQPQPVPKPPKTHRLADIAAFGWQCLPLLDPATVQPGIDHLERCQASIANATMSHHTPPNWQAHELRAAASLLGQAKQALAGALERLALCHRGLQRYLIGAIGTLRITQRPRRGPASHTRRNRVSRQIRAASDAARTATEKSDRAGAATQRVERRNARRSKKKTVITKEK